MERTGRRKERQEDREDREEDARRFGCRLSKKQRKMAAQFEEPEEAEELEEPEEPEEPEVPEGLTPDQATYLPRLQDMYEKLLAVETAPKQLAKDLIMAVCDDPDAQAFWLDKLMNVQANFTKVDMDAVHAACNNYNEKVKGIPNVSKFMQGFQKHGAGTDACILVDGKFPTTTAVNACTQTLADPNSATVQAMVLLSEHKSVEAFIRNTARANEMPTTLEGEYTLVPKKSDFQLFEAAHVQLLRELFLAGMQVYHAVADTNEGQFSQALHGTFLTLCTSNGSKLQLHAPPGDAAPILASFPTEHLSHLFWQALKQESRAWVAVGIAETRAVLADLLNIPRPDCTAMREVIATVKHVGWYKGGAAIGAYCRTVRRMQFHHVYGAADGEKRWRDWYTGFCRRGAAESNKVVNGIAGAGDKKDGSGPKMTCSERGKADGRDGRSRVDLNAAAGRDGGAVQQGSFSIPATASAASAKTRTGKTKRKVLGALAEMPPSGSLPNGVVSRCMSAEGGSGGCGKMQEHIQWEKDGNGEVCFVVWPHGSACTGAKKGTFRPARFVDGKWVLLTKEELAQMSQPKATDLRKKRLPST